MCLVGSSDCSSKERGEYKNNREEAFYGDGPFYRAACPGGAGGKKGKNKEGLSRKHQKRQKHQVRQKHQTQRRVLYIHGRK